MDFVTICGQSFHKTPITGGDVLNFELLKVFGKKKSIYLIINDITVPYARRSLGCQIIAIKDLLKLNNLVQRHLFLVPIAFINSIIKINKILRRKFDNPLILYSPGDFICNIVPMVLHKKRHPNSKLVVRVHHINENPFRRKGNSFLASLFSFVFQRLSLHLIKEHADLILLLNHEVKKSLLQLGFRSEKLNVLGAGVDIAKIDKVKDREPRDNSVVFLGRFSRTKGVFDLPKIWPIVLKEIPGVRLILIGAGNDVIVKRLKNEFAKVGVLNTVKFKGFIEESQDVYKILKTGKIFISPSYEEGWGIVVFEAVACGLLPVVYDLPVFKEIFGKSIQAVRLSDVATFAKTIIKFLKNEKLRKEYVLNLNKKMKRYDWDKVAGRELRLIREFEDEG